MVQKERRSREVLNGRLDLRRAVDSVVERNWVVENRVMNPPEDYESRRAFVDTLTNSDFKRLKDRMVNVTELFRDLIGRSILDCEIQDFIDELKLREIAPVFKRPDMKFIRKTYFVLAWDYERLTGKIWESKDRPCSAD